MNEPEIYGELCEMDTEIALIASNIAIHGSHADGYHRATLMHARLRFLKKQLDRIGVSNASTARDKMREVTNRLLSDVFNCA